MKTIALLLISLGVFISAPSAFAKIRVQTTLPSFADITRNVGGDAVSVSSITKGTQDPHFVDAKPDYILDLNKADLLIRAGLGLEDGWLPPLLTGSRNGKIQMGSKGDLDISTVVELREVPKSPLDRSMGDVHPGGNPHYMADPRNGAVVAQAIAKRLGEIEPDKSAEFKKRADNYATELKKHIVGWEKQLKKLSGTSVVTYHKSWVYFSAWAGLNEVGYLEPKPGIPPSPSHTVEIINLIKSKKVKLILMEPFYAKGVAESVAQTTGAKLLVLPVEVEGTAAAKNYIALFDYIVAELTK